MANVLIGHLLQDGCFASVVQPAIHSSTHIHVHTVRFIAHSLKTVVYGANVWLADVGKGGKDRKREG